MIFENMKAMYPKIFRGQVIGFDSEKNAYSTTPLFEENKANPGKRFEVGKTPATIWFIQSFLCIGNGYSGTTCAKY